MSLRNLAIATGCVLLFSSPIVSNWLTSWSAPEWDKPMNRQRPLSKIAHQVAVEDTLRVRLLQVVNSRGTVVIEIGADGFDDGAISVGGSNGRLGVAIDIDGAGSGRMVIRNPSSSAAGGLAIDADEGPTLSLIRDSQTVAGFNAVDGMIVLHRPSPSTSIGAITGFNTDGEPVVAIDDGRNSATLHDNEMQIRVSSAGRRQSVVRAFANEAQEGRVETYDEDGSTIWSSSWGGGSDSGLLGDLNGDNTVDFTDFLIFARQFGRTN